MPQFRIATYNIHKGIGGLDRRYQPARIAETLARYNPDIVLMQEVDDGVPRSRMHCQVEWFAEALEMRHHAFQRNVQLTRRALWQCDPQPFSLARYPTCGFDDSDEEAPSGARRALRITTRWSSAQLATGQPAFGIVRL